jgi:hypothetical protein
MRNIGGQAGYKCNSCPLTLCLTCSNKIFYGNKKRGVHNHPLALKNRNSWKCDICKTMYKGNASFYCKECDFDACEKCYLEEAGYQQGGYPPQQGGYPPQQGGYPPQQGGYPPQQGGYPPQQGGYPPQQGGYAQQPDSAHEHPLNYQQQINDQCKICLQNVGGQAGYTCGQCKLILCLNCSNRVFYGNKQKAAHKHPLALRFRNSWKCDLCKKLYKGVASFYCKQCDFDACDKCYLQY